MNTWQRLPTPSRRVCLCYPNLRRPFEVHINQHHADFSIDGIGIVATAALNLPFTRAHLWWNAFTYEAILAHAGRHGTATRIIRVPDPVH